MASRPDSGGRAEPGAGSSKRGLWLAKVEQSMGLPASAISPTLRSSPLRPRTAGTQRPLGADLSRGSTSPATDARTLFSSPRSVDSPSPQHVSARRHQEPQAPATGRAQSGRPGMATGFRRAAKEYVSSPKAGPHSAPRFGAQGKSEDCPMECPVEGHTKQPEDRLKHVTSRLEPLLRGSAKSAQENLPQFRVFGAHAALAWTAVQLCEVLSSSSSAVLRAGALWGLGSVLCELNDLQNFVGGDNTIMAQIFSDATSQDSSETLQSCAAYAVACLARFNKNMQDRAICERGVVLKFAEVLQESTNSAVLFTNLQAVGNICYNNVRAQQQFAADGVLSTVNALCHARDSRISQTACRCRATFLQLLARAPEVRVSISQQAPFDPLGLSSSAPEDSDRCQSEPASPCGGQPSRLASSYSLSKLASTSLLHRRRPETSKGRLNSNSSTCSPLDDTQLSNTLQERHHAPAANTCVPSNRGKAGWLPVKQREIAHGPSSPPRQLF